MRKTCLLILSLALVFAPQAFAAAEGSTGKQAVRIFMTLPEEPAVNGETIRLEIRVANVSGVDFTEPMFLYGPDGKEIGSFGKPVLKNNEQVVWHGSWTVNRELLKDGKISYTLRYSIPDENGNQVRKTVRFRKTFAVTEPVPEPAETEAPPEAESLPEVILFSVFRPNPGSSRFTVACIDRAGDFWYAEEADVEWPARVQDVVETVIRRRGMTRKESLIGTGYDGETLDRSRFTELASMAAAAETQDSRPVKTGADFGQEEIYALRRNRDGEEEAVLLGISGSYVFGNQDRNAQALYRFMWRQLRRYCGAPGGFGYASEIAMPRGFEMITVRDFFGLQDVNAETAVITAALEDCETGMLEADLTEEGTAFARKLLTRGVIIEKRNSLVTTGGTFSYFFSDGEGRLLGRIDTFEGNTLAVARDGMYTISFLPEPAESLTPEERERCSFRLEGIEYTLGVSTPRDLIHHGWNCSLEADGTYVFRDPACYSEFYVSTAGGGADEPIRSVSFRFAGSVDLEYCGFDGIVNPDDPEDPDTVWWNRSMEEDTDGGDGGPAGDDPVGAGLEKSWEMMYRWLRAELHAERPENGIGYSAAFSLSNGSTLHISSVVSPPVLSLE